MINSFKPRNISRTFLFTNTIFKICRYSTPANKSVFKREKHSEDQNGVGKAQCIPCTEVRLYFIFKILHRIKSTFVLISEIICFVMTD